MGTSTKSLNMVYGMANGSTMKATTPGQDQVIVWGNHATDNSFALGHGEICTQVSNNNLKDFQGQFLAKTPVFGIWFGAAHLKKVKGGCAAAGFTGGQMNNPTMDGVPMKASWFAMNPK